MESKFSRRRRSRGQGLVEYALLIALVATVVVVGLVTLAPRINTIFQSVGPGLSPVATVTEVPTATPAHPNNGCGNNGAGNGGVGNCH